GTCPAGGPGLRAHDGTFARGTPEARGGPAGHPGCGWTPARYRHVHGADPAGAPEAPRRARAGGMSTFIEKLQHAWAAHDSLVCVGLDPEIERFPKHIAAEPSPIYQFNKAIIDATHDLVCAYKLQFAHYAAYEAEDQLERTIEYLHKNYPQVPVILDA